MNLPNKLTLMRIALVPLLLLFLVPLPWSRAVGWNAFLDDWIARLIAVLIFSAASLTDLFDGRIARKRNLVTTFGKFVDPIADKLLVIAALVGLVQLGRVHTFVAMIIIFREFAVTGVRMLAAEKGEVIAARWFGKVKAVFQMITIIWMLAEPIMLQIPGLIAAGSKIATVGNLLMFVTILLTVLSGWDYVYKAKDLILA